MAIYSVRSSKAAKVLMGQRKQAIIEDAVGKAEAIPIGSQTVVILQVNDLPLRLVIQVANRVIDIITNEEADSCGVMNPPSGSSN